MASRACLALIGTLTAVALAGCTGDEASVDADTAQDEVADAITPMLDQYAELTGRAGDVRRDGVTDLGCTDDEQRAQQQVVFTSGDPGAFTVDDARAVYVDFIAAHPDLDVREGMNLAGDALTDRVEDGTAFYEVRTIVRDGYTMTLLVDVGPADEGGTVIAVDAYTDCLG